MDKKTLNKNWVHYLTRPFNLFSTSLWYRWYTQPKVTEMFNTDLPDALFIEEKNKSVRQYRIKDQLERFNLAIEQFLVRNDTKCKESLRYGLSLNEEAKKILSGSNKYNKLEDLLDFLDSLLLFSTILPFFTYENIQKLNIKEPDILALSESLRKESYYMDILEKIVLPAVKIRIKEFTKIDPNQIIEVITVDELLSGKPHDLQTRLENRARDKYFVYQILNGKEEVSWVDDPDPIIQEIEKSQPEDDMLELAGQIACQGKVQGKARIIFDPSKEAQFDKGDILVTINSNPTFMSLIKKCSAIVTDEGGMTCHASIISREMNIPCIVGTKVATKVLHDDDLIEVDANKGIVKIIK